MEVVALYIVFGSLIAFILCLVGCVASFLRRRESTHTVNNATQTDAYRQPPSSAASTQTDVSDVTVSSPAPIPPVISMAMQTETPPTPLLPSSVMAPPEAVSMGTQTEATDLVPFAPSPTSQPATSVIILSEEQFGQLLQRIGPSRLSSVAAPDTAESYTSGSRHRHRHRYVRC